MAEESGEMTQASQRALVVPVGGTPGAPLRAIQEVSPQYVAFVASRDTAPNVAEIERALGRVLPWKRVITTPNPQDLNATYRQIATELPRALDEWGVTWAQVTVDLTGGTKVMTAALMLATIHRAQQYLYVGGTERDRGGTGVVVTGHEMPVQTLNPWEQFATDTLRQITWAFNRLQFAVVIALAQQASERAAVERQAYLRALAGMGEGFAAWDRFDYPIARRKLHGCLAALAQEWGSHATQRPLIGQVEQSLRTLDELLAAARREAPSHVLLRDLISNALRRGDIEQRYDDAVARLYRFVEGVAQQALWDDYGLATSAVPVEHLPENGRLGEVRRQAEAANRRRVELPLLRTYEFLRAKGHRLGNVVERVDRGGEIGKLLVARNNSLLAHGSEPIGKRSYEALLDQCLALVGWSRGELTGFPVLPEY